MIRIEKVTKQFDSKRAVDGVSFSVERGGVFGLLGPNGAGKTTLIRMLMDIIRPDSGTILYDGRPMDARIKDRICYLPEERGLYKKERVQDLLEYFGELKGLPAARSRERAGTYLEKLGMTAVARNRVEELSKGNQQKIQLASTLVSDPDVIILDEPFSGLDPLNVRLAKELLAEERAKGKTILLSTHQMNQVEALCDSLLMIHHGRLVLYGSLDEILRKHSEPALWIECSPFEAHIPEIDRVVPEGKYLKLYPKPGITATEVIKSMIEREIQIEQFRKASTPLEEIFVKVARQSPPEGAR